MNRVVLIGRLTSDPEVRYSQGERATVFARFTLAVDRKYKKEGQPTADFITCSAIGKTGEFAEKYLHKGIKIAVQGAWQTGSYTNKDGAKVYTNECLVDSCEFCESKNQEQQPAAQTNTDSFMEIPDNLEEELPFL